MSAALPDHLTLPDTTCRCGSRALRIVVPGAAAERHAVAGMLRRPKADRGWCSTMCAQADGWPWLHSETAGRRRRVAA